VIRYALKKTPTFCGPQLLTRSVGEIERTIEQAISSHPPVAECCIVGIPDYLTVQPPFAFVTLSVAEYLQSAVLDTKIAGRTHLVGKQVDALASLGGIVRGKGLIPSTRSG